MILIVFFFLILLMFVAAIVKGSMKQQEEEQAEQESVLKVENARKKKKKEKPAVAPKRELRPGETTYSNAYKKRGKGGLEKTWRESIHLGNATPKYSPFRVSNTYALNFPPEVVEKWEKSFEESTTDVPDEDIKELDSFMEVLSQDFDDLDALIEALEGENEKLRAANKEWSREFDELMSYQLEGRAAEARGEIEEAIKSYELCVKYGEISEIFKINNYMYSIERLAILYRKQKDYKSEIFILQTALRHEKLDSNQKDRLKNRLEKAKILNNKKKT